MINCQKRKYVKGLKLIFGFEIEQWKQETSIQIIFGLRSSESPISFRSEYYFIDLGSPHSTLNP
jgi:hypothetical protein